MFNYLQSKYITGQSIHSEELHDLPKLLFLSISTLIGNAKKKTKSLKNCEVLPLPPSPPNGNQEPFFSGVHGGVF